MSDAHRREAALRCFRDLVGERRPSSNDVASAGELLRRHGLGPLLYVAGHRGFRGDYVGSRFASERRKLLLKRALAALEQRGIDVVLLKGISYVGDLYVDPAERPMGDIDLLVPALAMERAYQALLELGFRDGTPGGRTPFHHAWQLFAGNLSLDLHRNILQPWRSAIDLDATWRRTRPCTDGLVARRLERIDQVLFHLAHIGRSELWAPMVSYRDAVLLYARLSAAERDTLWRRARQSRTSRMCRAAHAMAEHLAFGSPLELPAWGRPLPSASEVIAFETPRRLPQLLRKLALVDSVGSLGGFGSVYLARRVSALWTRRRGEVFASPRAESAN